MTTQQPAVKPKRGPGRPPRKVIPSTSVLGIVPKPIYEETATVEFAYYDPMVWKSVFSILKGLKVRDIYFRFCSNKFYIYAKDHVNNRIRIDIDCSQSLSYYCADADISLCINRDNIDKLFPSINKTIDRITFTYCDHDDCLTVECNDPQIGKVKQRRIVVSRVNYVDDIYPLEVAISPDYIKLYFTLPLKDFKDTISDASNSGDKITISKRGRGNLNLSFNNSHSNKGKDEYHECDKISMASTLMEDDYFTCSLYVFTLKAMCSSSQSQKITMYCMNDDAALVEMNVGDIVKFNLLTETKLYDSVVNR